MKILGLDLGTRTGWSRLGTEAGLWLWGELDLSVGKYEGGGMRYLRFERHLSELLVGIDLVAYEAVKHVKYVGAAEVLFGLSSVLQRTCEAEGVPYQGVQIGELKKHATGKGNAGKPAMASALHDRLRPELAPAGAPLELTDNEVDAIWLADYARTRLVPQGSAL